jgi:hypothetical protein
VISAKNVFPQNFLRPWKFGWQIILTPYAQHKTNMAVNGWCPFMVNILSGVSVQGYAHTCKHPHFRRSYEGHKKCTTHKCVINMKDTNNYVPRHVIGTCNCVMFKPSLENVIGFLSIGKILLSNALHQTMSYIVVTP